MESLDHLAESFRRLYPESGTPSLCRAPGRVNLIGEHTDYNGLSVLPMAIDREIRIAFAPRPDGLVRMASPGAVFATAEFRNADRIPPSLQGAWDNYCKAAVAGLNQHFRVRDFPGMDMLVTGDIPIAAGLSSSSALVVGCALAYLRCLGKTLEIDITRLALAGLLAEAEHYVGTRGGGMDQAIILLGKAGQACKIDFAPLRFERSALPDDCTVVVCNSLVKADKSGSALHRYNAGPRLCKLITALVASQVRTEFGDGIEIARLADLWNGHLCLTHTEVRALFDATFPKPRMSLDSAARRLGTTVASIRERWLGDLEEPLDGFPLQAKARHQLTEHQRVERARDAMALGDSEMLGSLMNASHESCAKDYDVSCPELDKLVSVAREAGAVGARLTGAGFGGCTVNLVPRTDLEGFREAVTALYYGEYCATRGLACAEPALFEVKAGASAEYTACADL